MQHLVRAQELDRETIELLFSAADHLSHETTMPHAGKILASLFYEPSTRTRFSFESAMMRLGGNVLTTENAEVFSSAVKGEALEDTIRVVSSYADVLVLRHPQIGAAERAARVATIPVINAGDGAGQHPTQALLDLYTIQRERGTIEGTYVAFAGDLKHARTARSLAYLLGKYSDIRITFVSTPALRMENDIKEYLDRHAIKWSETDSLENVVEHVDALYQTRLQTERMQATSPARHPSRLTRELAERMRPNAIIMHPLPRRDEIPPEIDALPQAKYFAQASYGLQVRMALLDHVLTQQIDK